MNSCGLEPMKLDVMTTDPESDDENVQLYPPSDFLHTPRDASRSLCFELSSTIVCTFGFVPITV